ncbi:LytR/AlgR family response regulator transcription factor [Flexithrix dorotheae]|uniref:LytR/AlgR family response regulator transcription factor n=1 Tax=Flexithrix dorotheae TaxID=70993 RepID=UPI0012FAC683|nr:response regulator [Flexithrix dorotheae]
MKILIVEDDVLMADMLAKRIERFSFNNFNVTGMATSVDKAIAEIEREKPDLALLDIELENDNEGGINIAKKINADYKIPFIYITGLPDEVGFVKAKHTLPFGFLKKPYDEASLQRVMELATLWHEKQMYPIVQNQEQNPLVFKPDEEDDIWLKTENNKYEKIVLADILWVKAFDHYIMVQLLNRKYPLTYKSKFSTFYEDYLANSPYFVQTQRSYVINKKYVDAIVDNKIKIGDKLIPIGQTFRSKVFKILGIR